MNIVVWNSPTIPADAPQSVFAADAVVYLWFGRDASCGPHETLAHIKVLRSNFGDPHDVIPVMVDIAYVDRNSAAAREKRKAEEIADAKATLARHGIKAL